MRKKKILIVSALTIICILCLLAFLFVNMGKNSEGAKVYKEQIQEHSAVITENLISEIDLATADAKVEVEQGITSETGQAVGTSMDTKNDASSSQMVENSAVQPKKQLTAEQEKAQKVELEKNLKTKYYAILLEQKAEAIAMVDSLVAQGKADYLNLKATGGWNATAKTTLMSDYMSRVGTMETAMDASFASLLAKMEANLKEEGIDPTQTIEYFNTQYSIIKEENRSAFLDKLVGQIQNRG